MTLEEFVEANRAEIDKVINDVIYRHDGKGGRGTIPDPPPVHDDEDRAEWVENDEGLWLWAKQAGVEDPE